MATVKLADYTPACRPDCGQAPPEGTQFRQLFMMDWGDLIYSDTMQGLRDPHQTEPFTNHLESRFDGEIATHRPHFSTPEVTQKNGLNIEVRIGRVLSSGGQPSFIEMRYNGLGKPTKIIDELGNVREQEWDSLGRLVRVDDPTIGETIYEYDGFGNLERTTDARGVVNRYVYDQAGRLQDLG